MIGSSIYLFGGYDNGTVEEYNIFSRSFKTVSSFYRRSFGICNYNETDVFIAGGEFYLNCSETTNNCVLFSSTNHSFRGFADMVIKRKGHVLVNVKGVTYCLGGWSAYNSNLPQCVELLDSIETVNPNTGNWELLPAKLSFPRADHQAVAHNQFIYILGGFCDNEEGVTVYAYSIERFNTVTGKIEIIKPKLHIGRSDFALGKVRSGESTDIYLLGGASWVVEKDAKKGAVNFQEVFTLETEELRQCSKEMSNFDWNANFGFTACSFSQSDSNVQQARDQSGASNKVLNQSGPSKQIPSQSETTKEAPSQSGASNKSTNQSEASKEVPNQSEASNKVASQSETSNELPSQPEASKEAPSQSEPSNELPSQSEPAVGPTADQKWNIEAKKEMAAYVESCKPIVDFILEGNCNTHLYNIYLKKTPCQNYEDLLAGRVKTNMGRWTLQDAPTIFLEDPDHILEVTRFCREICGTMEDRHEPRICSKIDRNYRNKEPTLELPRLPRGIKVKPVVERNSPKKVIKSTHDAAQNIRESNIGLHVFLPEAVIHAIMKIRKMKRPQAEKVFNTGYTGKHRRP